ncbi:helicase HerA domain-containing protein [Gordonia phosphorivorans]|uniref:Helicase HerA domain-containing protein n=1 Tax=Gordonia phosphorivorans TaxID=1056982 RepID=A0ABV6H5R9_9ACTN
MASPSTCERLELILDHASARQPLLGALLAVSIPFDEGVCEMALGTITAIETVNSLVEARGPMASHIAADTDQISHAAQDNRRVIVKVEAVFRGQPGAWRRWSSTLSNSPATGTRVQVLDQSISDDLMSDCVDAGYIGTLRGTGGVHVPLTLPDFSGQRGARHFSVLGATGSGKTAVSDYLLATMMRHPKLAILVLDPQSQFQNEYGLPISLQGVASALGRTVHVARISQSLRLQKDAPMFMRLLHDAGFFRLLAFGGSAEDNIAAARTTFVDAVTRTRDLETACGTGDWTEAPSDQLLRYLLQTLWDILPTGTIYAGRDQQERVAATIYRPTEDSRGEPIAQTLLDRLPAGALDPAGTTKFDQLLEVFSALHQLWLPFNAAGLAEIAAGTDPEQLGPQYRRRAVWGLLSEALRPAEDRPAPLVIMDLSADLSADSKAAEILDSQDVKARIMRQLVAATKRVGQAEFAAGRSLNALWVVDEAWAWAGPVDARTQSESIVQLSNEFAAAARDVRKFGIGMLFITQSATSLRDDIWRQLTVVLVGYGLHDQADLKKLSNRVSESHVALYRTAPPPEATGRYTWMCIGGGVTGLSFGSNPIFLEVYTDAADWLARNQSWITGLRRTYLHCLPDGDTGGPLTEIPPRPVPADEVVAAHSRRMDVINGPVAGNVMSAFTAATTSTAATPAPVATPRGRWATTDTDDMPPY